MENEIGQTPEKKSKKMLWVIVGIIILLLLGWLIARGTGFLGRQAAEKAIEEASGGKADVNLGNDGSTEVKTDEGTGSTANKLPDNWPSDVPAYPNAKIELSGSSNANENRDEGIAVIFITDDSAQKTADYFKQELKNQQWTIETTADVGGSQVLSAKKDDREFGLSAMTAEGQTRITVAITKKK